MTQGRRLPDHGIARASPPVPLAAGAGGATSRPVAGVGEHRAHRVGANVARAGIHARVVLEAPEFVAHRVATLKDPHRVVLELDGVAPDTELAQLPTRVQAADPYIAAIRFGTRAPDTLRIVFDLKTETRTQLFVLEAGGRVRIPRRPRSLSADAARSA